MLKNLLCCVRTSRYLPNFHLRQIVALACTEGRQVSPKQLALPLLIQAAGQFSQFGISAKLLGTAKCDDIHWMLIFTLMYNVYDMCM